VQASNNNNKLVDNDMNVNGLTKTSTSVRMVGVKVVHPSMSDSSIFRGGETTPINSHAASDSLLTGVRDPDSRPDSDSRLTGWVSDSDRETSVVTNGNCLNGLDRGDCRVLNDQSEVCVLNKSNPTIPSNRNELMLDRFGVAPSGSVVDGEVTLPRASDSAATVVTSPSLSTTSSLGRIGGDTKGNGFNDDDTNDLPHDGGERKQIHTDVDGLYEILFPSFL